MKLFNVIQSAQDEAKTTEGKQKGVEKSALTNLKTKGKTKTKDKDNLLGRGKDCT